MSARGPEWLRDVVSRLTAVHEAGRASTMRRRASSRVSWAASSAWRSL
ncbi:hypothetical protein ABGB19_12735 [Mycobacterium sp. B14F4]